MFVMLMMRSVPLRIIVKRRIYVSALVSLLHNVQFTDYAYETCHSIGGLITTRGSRAIITHRSARSRAAVKQSGFACSCTARNASYAEQVTLSCDAFISGRCVVADAVRYLYARTRNFLYFFVVAR